MKKFITMIFLGLVLFSGLIKVSAVTITLEDVGNKLKSEDFVDIMDPFQSVKDSGTITIKDNAIEIVSRIDEETSSVVTTIFNYQNGVISFNFSGDKNSSEDIIANVVDSIWIVYLINAVADLKGYSETEITNFLNSVEEDEDWENFTYENNGFEIIFGDYLLEEEEINMSGNYIDTFKININNFSIDGNSNNNNQNNDIENPQTGIKAPYIILGLGGLGVILFIFNRRKNKIYDI